MIHNILVVVQIDILIYAENIRIPQDHPYFFLIVIHLAILLKHWLSVALILGRLSANHTSKTNLQGLLDIFG